MSKMVLPNRKIGVICLVLNGMAIHKPKLIRLALPKQKLLIWFPRYL